MCAAALGAHAPSGAIFTTLADGSEVNVNQYAAKTDVYLDGGPGIGAPATAAGLDNGFYVFQVTDPSGRTLLSTDPALCRQFEVFGGIIVGVVVTGCQHVTGFDVDPVDPVGPGAVTVQLMPYLDTPNPGGVYKVWVTPVEDYLAGCRALGVTTNILTEVDCGREAGNFHGFLPAHSKTDNFKVGEVPIREIDTVFVKSATGELLSGLRVTWIDPLGVPNAKWSYPQPFWPITEAHVEAVEDGAHQIVIEPQTGGSLPDGTKFDCTAGEVWLGYFGHTSVGFLPQQAGEALTVVISIKGHNRAVTEFITVYCQ